MNLQSYYDVLRELEFKFNNGLERPEERKALSNYKAEFVKEYNKELVNDAIQVITHLALGEYQEADSKFESLKDREVKEYK